VKNFFAHSFPAYVSAIAAVVVAWVAVFTVGPILDKYALQKEAEALKEEVAQLQEESMTLKTLVAQREGDAARLGAENQELEKAVAAATRKNGKLTADFEELQALNKMEEEKNAQLAKNHEALLTEIEALQRIYASHIAGLITLNVRAQLADQLRAYAWPQTDPLLMLLWLQGKLKGGVISGRGFIEHALTSPEIAGIPLHTQNKVRQIANAFVDGRAGLYDTNLRIPELRRVAIRKGLPKGLPKYIELMRAEDIQAGNFGSYQQAWEKAKGEITAEINNIRRLAADIERSLPDLEAEIVDERKTLTNKD
jgi:hypothetical protein